MSTGTFTLGFHREERMPDGVMAMIVEKVN